MEPLEWIAAAICISPILAFFSFLTPSVKKQAWYIKFNDKAKKASVGIINFLHYRTMWRLIHPKISVEAKVRFNAGLYADAIEASCKVIDEEVQKRVENETGLQLYGQALMMKAFGGNKPVLQLTNTSNHTGKSVQEGFMHLFTGTVGAFRNPTAHKNLNLDAVTAIKFLFFASLLMDELEGDIIQAGSKHR